MGSERPGKTVLTEQAVEEARIWRENPYYDRAEYHMAYLWDGTIWPVIEDFDFDVTVDLACGHGRNTARLAPLARVVYAMDVNEENVAFCRSRFAGDPKVIPLRNDGVTLEPLEDASVTAVYCFDAMVHFDSDIVRAYLADTARVLTPAGRAFFHHSNYAGAPAGHFHTNPHARNFMTKELFAHYAAKSGLTVLFQKPIDWGTDRGLDCISVVGRAVPPASNAEPA